MRKTIFTKLMQLSLSVVLVSSVVLGGIHFYLINNYTNAAHLEMLKNNILRINQLIGYLSFDNTPLTQRVFQVNIDAISQNAQAHIIMTDVAGNVIYLSNSAQKYVRGNVVDISSMPELFAGKTVVKKGVFNTLFGGRTLTVAGPLGTEDSIYGAVFMTVSARPVRQETLSILTLLLISIVASIAIALLLSYFLSRNMSRQIRQLSRAAQAIARGDFSKRSVISNVEELDELALSFQSMAGDLEKQDKVRISFIANVSHDLRTPMTTINGFVQGILDGTIPPDRQEHYLSVVLSECRRLSDLVNTFLDLSRYESGEVILDKTSVEINEMLRDILQSFESIITQKQIKVNLRVDSKRAMVLVDEQAMQRVFVNLIDNAMKFVEFGGTVDITVVRKRGKTFVSVANSGATLSEEEQKFVWDRFYKADTSRGETAKGSGLGLFIVKNIVNRHGEKILLESKDNQVKFTVTLQNDTN